MNFVKENHFYKTWVGIADIPTDIFIGNPLGDKFIPQIDMSKWNGEAWMRTSFPAMVSSELATYDGINDRISLMIGNYTFRWYLHPNESLEYEIILVAKPIGGQNSFTLNLDFPPGLEFYYQPALTQAEIDAGFSRPENVVGSYAVYWGKQNNQYRTGKLCHIYRPQLIDALGNKAWATLAINTVAKTMTITADSTWLKNAAYPVVIDPTFGEAAGGASTFTFTNYIMAKVAAPADGDGTADSISFYCGSWVAGGKVKGALYLNSNSSLLTPQTEEKSSGAGGVNTFNFTGGPSVTNGTNYGIAVWNGDYSVSIQYDTGGVSGNSKYQNLTYGTWPNPATLTNSDAIYSVYCTYTPAAGGYAETVSGVGFALAADLARKAMYDRGLGGDF